MSTINWSEYVDACKNAMYPDFPEASDSEASEASEMCFLLLTKGEKPNFNLETIPKIFASSYGSLWKKYWTVMKTTKTEKKDQPKVPGKKYQEAFRKMTEDPETKVFPILLTAEIHLAVWVWGTFVEGKPLEPEPKVSKGLVAKSKPDSSGKTIKTSKVTNDLPQVYLVHIPKRKAWPYALMGETKKIKDFLKFSDYGQKISAYVSNVNSELGPGWNLKDEAKELVEEQHEKTLEMKLVTLDDFKAGVHAWN